MQYPKNLPTSVSALIGAGLVIATGCGDVEQSASDVAASDDAGTETQALRGHWHHTQRGGTAGSPTTGGTAMTTGGSSSGTGGGSTGTAGSSVGENAAGSGGSSSSPGCGICERTQSCCEAVNAGALCTFSADTCASLDPVRQAYYASDCLMVLRTTIGAQTINQHTAPTACSMP